MAHLFFTPPAINTTPEIELALISRKRSPSSLNCPRKRKKNRKGTGAHKSRPKK